MLLPGGGGGGGWGGTSSQSRELRGESRYGGKSMRGGLNPPLILIRGVWGTSLVIFFLNLCI